MILADYNILVRNSTETWIPFSKVLARYWTDEFLKILILEGVVRKLDSAEI